MNLQKRFHTWWQGREPRERWMLGVMFAMLAAFVWWYGLLMPLRHVRAVAQAGYDRAAADAGIVRLQAAGLRAQAERSGNGPSAEMLIASATKAGVPISRQRRSEGKLMLGIDSIQTEALFAWLDTLHKDHAAGPDTLQIEKRDGALRVELTLAVADTAGSDTP